MLVFSWRRMGLAAIAALALLVPARAGNQVNARFGQVIRTRAPRVMQIALRVVF